MGKIKLFSLFGGCLDEPPACNASHSIVGLDRSAKLLRHCRASSAERLIDNRMVASSSAAPGSGAGIVPAGRLLVPHPQKVACLRPRSGASQTVRNFDGYGSIATSKRVELAEDESVPSVMMVTSAQRGGRYGRKYR
jgi:hypothetical protein